MVDMSFAEYILSEKSLSEKMKIILYFKRKHECFFDNTVIFKTEMAREFLEHTKLDIDSNLVLTACLLYGCKKTAIAYDINKVKTYAKEGAEYLKTLGFDDHFCQICMQVNRYEPVQNREKEGDFLELIDNFGMLLDRDDRRAFTPVEALFILENENLAGHDQLATLDFAEQKGEAKGFVRGHAQGRVEGTLDVARRMKAMSIPVETISLCTGLSLDEIAGL